jgi:hypothetical protein
MDTAKEAAIQVLLHNSRGPYNGLPRTAGWGYPEPYTRDWMIAALGVLVSKNEELMEALRRMLSALAAGQTALGNIPSLAHNPEDSGASDTTPLFLIALTLFRSVTGESRFLEEAAERSLNWLAYQSPDDVVLTAQQPTSDWRDEQWVWGYGLYVNSLVYACLRLYGHEEQAKALSSLMNHAGLREVREDERIHEGLALSDQPYYALYVYKIHISKRFDLLGNSLAMLFGVADQQKANQIIDWVENSMEQLQASKQLACNLPPCLMPYIREGDGDWMPRYSRFNRPGEYHNGGIWPFVAGFYIAALTAAGRHELAAEKMESFSALVRPARRQGLEFGFNEWLRAQDCSVQGQDWQTWSAAMYLYAAECVQQRRTPMIERSNPLPGETL